MPSSLRESFRVSKVPLELDEAIDATCALFAELETLHRRGLSLEDLPAQAMAPERAGTLPHTPGSPADLYAAGAWLFHALAGVWPFETDDLSELLHFQLTCKPARLPAPAPRALVAILDRLMSPNPGDRYQTAAGALYDLKSLRRALRSGQADPPLVIGRKDRRTSLTEPDLAGRSRTLADLATVLDSGTQKTVSGPAGSGKSRLLNELGGRAESLGWKVLKIRGQALSSAPLAGLGDLGRLLPEDLDEGDPSLVETTLERLMASLPQRFARPVLLLVDDAQWADPWLVRALRHMSRQPRDLAVVLARREPEGLAPLDDIALQAMLESMAGPLPREVVELVARWSEGVPFLAVEALRGLVESGSLVADSQGWSLIRVPELPSASNRAAALLDSRLSSLPDQGRTVLEAVALAGATASVDLLSTATGLPSEQVEVCLQAARERRLLWSDRLTLTHDRLRERLEETADPGMHAAIAEWLVREQPQEHYRIAHHQAQAGRISEALEPALRAARQARRRHDLELAERAYRIALRAANSPLVKEELAGVLVARGAAFEEARRLLDQALEECSGARDRSRIEGALAALYFRQDEPAAALELLARALTRLDQPWAEPGMPLRLARELVIHCRHLRSPQGLYQEPIVDPARFRTIVTLYKQTAETAFELGRHDLVFWAHLFLLNLIERHHPTPELGNLYAYHLAALAGTTGRGCLPSRAWRHGFAALERFGTPRERGKARVWLAFRHYKLGRLHQAERTLRQAIALLQRAGDQWEVQIARSLLSEVLTWRGRIQEAEALAREAHQEALRWNSPLAAARALMAWAMASNGDIPARLIEEQIEAGRGSYRLLELYQARAFQLAGADRYLEAVAWLDRAVAEWKPPGSFLAPILAWKARWLRLAGEDAGARRAVRQALKLVSRWPLAGPQVLREAALLAARRGNVLVARRYLDQSLEEGERLGLVLEVRKSFEERRRLGQALGWEPLQPQAIPTEPVATRARLEKLVETTRQLLTAATAEEVLDRAARALQVMLRAEGCELVEASSCPPLCREAGREGRACSSEEPASLCVPIPNHSRLFHLTHSGFATLFTEADLEIADTVARLTAAVLESRQAEARFRTLFDNAGVGLQLVDLEGRVVRENSYLAETLGLASGASVLDLVEPDDRSQEEEFLHQLARGDRDEYSLFLRHRRRSGDAAWTQVTASLIRDAHGAPSRIVRAVSDVSTRHLRQLVALGERQRQLLSLDLHDVVAQSLVLVTQKSYLDDHEQALEQVRDQTNKAIVEVRRLCRELASPDLQQRSYSRALRDYVASFSADTGIEVELRMGGGKAPRGLAGLFCYRIVQEALSNVRRHAGARKVRVRLRAGDQEVRGEVRDDGHGFSPGDRRDRLGLKGIKLRAELLGGKARIQSRSGGGTRILFTLPLEEPPCESSSSMTMP